MCYAIQSLALLDPFQLDSDTMRDWGWTPNRSLAATAIAFHAWHARRNAR